MATNVMLLCRSGTWRMVGDHWEDEYHVITFTTCEDPIEALRIAYEQVAASPRQVRRAWIEEATD